VNPLQPSACGHQGHGPSPVTWHRGFCTPPGSTSAAERSTRRHATHHRTLRPTPPSRARSLDSPHPRRSHGRTRHPFDANCERAARARVAPKPQAPGVHYGSRSRLPRVPTPPHQARCRGDSRDRDDPLLPPDCLWRAPHGQSHPKPLERGHPTRRVSAGREDLPQTTSLLSVRGCKWESNPLSSFTSYTATTRREDTT
jgi:hypothetical protein